MQFIYSVNIVISLFESVIPFCVFIGQLASTYAQRASADGQLDRAMEVGMMFFGIMLFSGS
ncbi:hypothetical protein A3D11_02600 [Candidatus Peribacteria bacterium RIFCSPHIGHO2_02_FULL_49_16]|nr:MAG: hypothetical protein A2880_01960 [Candidatus Peribacteria bacterium RIFCSPHIGHO2_01_FULL_49_38]OGJ58486.1 MAG: hypothetical protein A3D11_02600 [Candidatus Peribacteria bacterium RIFCSPHIGHO2_02_FULL_49_16]